MGLPEYHARRGTKTSALLHGRRGRGALRSRVRPAARHPAGGLADHRRPGRASSARRCSSASRIASSSRPPGAPCCRRSRRDGNLKTRSPWRERVGQGKRGSLNIGYGSLTLLHSLFRDCDQAVPRGVSRRQRCRCSSCRQPSSRGRSRRGGSMPDSCTSGRAARATQAARGRSRRPGRDGARLVQDPDRLARGRGSERPQVRATGSR